MELGLGGKVALVTGASRGIGAAVAQELAREGMDLFLVARSGEDLARQADGISKEFGRKTACESADLREPEAAARVVAAALAAHGRLDLVVNAAGATKRGDFFSLTDEDFLDGFALKFHGAVRLCRAAWPHLAASGGSVVNIIGMGSRHGSADFTIGGSVNAALHNFTKSLADLANGTGIRVNAINPGIIETTRVTGRLEIAAKAQGVPLSELIARQAERIGIGRLGRPEEVGWLIAYLASERAGFVHGSIIDMDGGTNRAL